MSARSTSGRAVDCGAPRCAVRRTVQPARGVSSRIDAVRSAVPRLPTVHRIARRSAALRPDRGCSRLALARAACEPAAGRCTAPDHAPARPTRRARSTSSRATTRSSRTSLDLVPGETVLLHVVNGGLVVHEAVIGDAVGPGRVGGGRSGRRRRPTRSDPGRRPCRPTSPGSGWSSRRANGST